VNVGSCHLTPVATADLHIPVLGNWRRRSFRSAMLSNRVRSGGTTLEDRRGGSPCAGAYYGLMRPTFRFGPL
jgi:hypothetical protein